MTLILDLDLDILKTYVRSKNKFLDQEFQELELEQVRQTDATISITAPHSRTGKQVSRVFL